MGNLSVSGGSTFGGGVTVSSGTLSVSSGAVFGNSVFVPAGVNTLSAAVSSMANGDCLMLDASTYTQSVRVKIPSSVTYFSIIGRGSANTHINYTEDVDALVSTLSGTTAHRIRRAKLEGFQCRYTNSSNATADGITLWGAGTNNVTSDPNIVMSDVSLVYDDSVGGRAWNRCVRLVDARENYLDKITIRKEANGRSGAGVRLESCMNTHLSGFYVMCTSNAIDLGRASSQYVLEHTAGSGVHHGCEDISISHGTLQICGRAINLGFMSFACKIHDMEIVAPTHSGIYEDVSSGAENGGYHHIHDVYIDSSTQAGMTMIYLRRPGTTVNGCALHLLNSSAYGIIVDNAATMNALTNNLLRSGGAGNYAGIYMLSSNNTMIGNRFENWNASGSDIYLGSSAAANVVAFNLIDYQITDDSAGTTNTIQFNPVH